MGTSKRDALFSILVPLLDKPATITNLFFRPVLKQPGGFPDVSAV
jgi:hypothetical protein